MRPRLLWLSLSALALSSGCGVKNATANGNESTAGSANPGSEKLATVQGIFNVNCVSCHNSTQHLGGLDLEEGTARTALVNVRSTESKEARVQPGNPDRSYLLAKVTGKHLEAGGQGGRMPLDGAPLPADKVRAIRDWIASGASG